MTTEQSFISGPVLGWRKCALCGTTRPPSLVQEMRIGESAPKVVCAEQDWCEQVRAPKGLKPEERESLDVD